MDRENLFEYSYQTSSGEPLARNDSERRVDGIETQLLERTLHLYYYGSLKGYTCSSNFISMARYDWKGSDDGVHCTRDGSSIMLTGLAR